MSDPDPRDIRLVEAVLFASAEPVSSKSLAQRLPETADLGAILEILQSHYAERGVQLVRVGSCWVFRTAPDLASALTEEVEVPRKMGRATLETLAIIAYHQPVTRAEIEEIRGVSLGRGPFDVLLQAGWIRPRGRRRTPGRPLTWGTSEAFLHHFGLESLEDLPGIGELKAAGLLDSRPAIEAYGVVAKPPEERDFFEEAESMAETDPLDPEDGLEEPQDA